MQYAPQIILSFFLTIKFVSGIVCAAKKYNKTEELIGSILGVLAYYATIAGLLFWGGFYK